MSPRKPAKPTIVLVEDDAFVAGMYVTKLLMGDYHVKLATDGQMGLTMIKEEKPDLVLLDLRLPKLSGWDILRKIKADPKTKNIPVMILTNVGQDADIEFGRTMGAVDYVIKAHHFPSEVMKKIDRYVKGME